MHKTIRLENYSILSIKYVIEEIIVYIQGYTVAGESKYTHLQSIYTPIEPGHKDHVMSFDIGKICPNISIRHTMLAESRFGIPDETVQGTIQTFQYDYITPENKP